MNFKFLRFLGFLFLLFTFQFSLLTNSVYASHCDDLDLNEPTGQAECARRVNRQTGYCDNNKISQNLNNGEHAPLPPNANCSIGEVCVMVNNSPSCQAPGKFGSQCEYPEQHPDGDYICRGIFKGTPSNLRCEYDSSVPPNCSKALEGGTVDQIFGKVQAPDFVNRIGFGAAGISTVLTNIIRLIYIVAGIIFVFMVIFSAVQWITSGGDKEKYGQARQRLTHAIIGIALLALAGVIITTLGNILGFEFFI
jgi:hypothetical protein